MDLPWWLSAVVTARYLDPCRAWRLSKCMSLAVLGNPKHEPNVGCHRSDHCKQTPLGSAGVNSRCARPEEPQITKLPCIDRSSVRCGHTSGRHFGKHAQRLFLSSRCSKSLA